MNSYNLNTSEVAGKFITKDNERYYMIENMDDIPPFFVSVVSNSDHWLFVSSTGGLSAGRVSPDTALFPYETVDKLHDNSLHSGCKTIVRATLESNKDVIWEPFNKEHNGRFKVTRNLYKNVLGNKLCFEEINHDLNLTFLYSWHTSDEYGFVRSCELINTSEQIIDVELIDGMQNLLPAGTPRFTQTNSSNLVDAYKWSELDEATRLAYFTLYSGITDRAEPCESLKANTVFSLGLENVNVLLSSEQVDSFRRGKTIQQEAFKRGIRGAYLIHTSLSLLPKMKQTWQFVANLEMSQQQVVALKQKLSSPEALTNALDMSIEAGSDALERIMSGADALQVTAEENVSSHHYANVLFNVLRGGIFDKHYQVSSHDFAKTIATFNARVFQRHQALFDALPNSINFSDLMTLVTAQDDLQLTRLCSEYLPISFGRRHGDPSRPWNQFAIKLVDENNNRLLSYQGNWRDIFQNWEALTFSYPEFIESVIAKFVNASTIDGYNPYRITKEGIDWEVEDPEDPWSYIGYWGDHQIIYLLKLLELSKQFHPEKLNELLHSSIFSYANVPYRIKSYEDIVLNAKSTVLYDDALAEAIEQRVATLGADGKLLLDDAGDVYQVNLLEKLLVTLLCKLGNLVIDGGIWLNTQRPEWNDANNALVGQGLSMVTLSYLRRYISFLQELLSSEQGTTQLSAEVATWLTKTADIFAPLKTKLATNTFSEADKLQVTEALGQAASEYRHTVYQQESFSSKVNVDLTDIASLLTDSLTAIDHSIDSNKRQDQLYNAYNLLEFKDDQLSVDELYPMLEGQVAALSSGYLTSKQVISVLTALFDSDVYREDQKTFMLYPDRSLPSFLEKNCVEQEQAMAIPLLRKLLTSGDQSLITQDVNKQVRFNANLNNIADVDTAIANLAAEYQENITASIPQIHALYEQVFNHKAFTGRSGGMFGFEGLGCIYWHMVSKLLLAVEEQFFIALDNNEEAEHLSQLAYWYYRVREGIGFNKTPKEYGAFPVDPYSHTPKHAGAQQPGMTGQVKEEVIARFGELGLRVENGIVRFKPNLLRACEFVEQATTFRYLDVDDNWQEIDVPAKSLAFTWCQVPIIYTLNQDESHSDHSLINISWQDKNVSYQTLELSAQMSNEIFKRSGYVRQLTVMFNESLLYKAN